MAVSVTSAHGAAQVIFKQGEIDMGDKGKKDKGKREQQKKAKLNLKDKRKLKKEKKNKGAVLSGDLKSSTAVRSSPS